MSELTAERRAENMRLRAEYESRFAYDPLNNEYCERAVDDLPLYEAALAETEREVNRLRDANLAMRGELVGVRRMWKETIDELHHVRDLMMQQEIDAALKGTTE